LCSFHGVGIAFSMPTLLCRVPALLPAKSFPLVGVLRQCSEAIETPALAPKVRPTLKIGVKIPLSPLLGILSGA
jgi:hypothetical protein